MTAQRATLEARFWAKVDKTDDCWNWTGARTNHGYGNFWVQPGHRPAHRVAYEMLVGEIPAGLHLDHLCRNRACVNPAHLEPVTQRENSLRGHSPTVLAYTLGLCMREGHRRLPGKPCPTCELVPGGGRLKYPMSLIEQVVASLDHMSRTEASRHFGIPHSTVRLWARKYVA